MYGILLSVVEVSNMLRFIGNHILMDYVSYLKFIQFEISFDLMLRLNDVLIFYLLFRNLLQIQILYYILDSSLTLNLITSFLVVHSYQEVLKYYEKMKDEFILFFLIQLSLIFILFHVFHLSYLFS